MRFFQSLAASVVAGALVVSVVGCGGRESGQKAIADQTKISQIQKGASTKADIQSLFGNPSGRSFGAAGDEVWTYRYQSTSVDPKTFIPLVGGFVGGATVQADTLIVSFGHDGLVKSYGVNKTGNAS
jgi:outer membrane protein assembly factor BamE (lipoprotein component of BamABCDE complex)